MTFYVAEGWATAVYRYTDPDVFLHCDNPACDRPWVTGTGLVCWALHDEVPLGTLFTERLLIACDASCLAAAQAAQRKRAAWEDRPRPYWSEPETVERWLDALRESLTRDPETTPVGELAPAIS
ncbi:MAG: hypothetical protein KC442_10340 [Thermomicrobiales bacterium]|nr:hypothetical protein [Thermomicrobiales bacterium]